MARINENLTIKEEKYLLSIGYLIKDLPQVAYAKDNITITNLRTNKPVSHKRAKRMLGVCEYISGVGRATFHGSSVRYCESKNKLTYLFKDTIPFGSEIPCKYYNS